MRIALLGTRGIPANYGGFETFAEELSTRLVARGHPSPSTAVKNIPGREYRGVRLLYLPTIRHKYLETLAHTFFSTFHLMFHRVDAALFCNGANAIFTPWPRLAGIPVALNVDGIERKRKKWNRLAQRLVPALGMARHFLPGRGDHGRAKRSRITTGERYGKAALSSFRTGPRRARRRARTSLESLAWSRAVTSSTSAGWSRRITPLEVRQAFESVVTPGSSWRWSATLPTPGNTSVVCAIPEDPRVVIPGAIYGEGYRQLGSHCFAYIHATEVGGTHPALIEAMGRGALVLYRNTPENAEVAGGAGIPFEAGRPCRETAPGGFDER